MNTTGGIETVLAGHQRRVDNGACWCDQWPTETHDETWSAHVAAAIVAHLLSDAVVERAGGGGLTEAEQSALLNVFRDAGPMEVAPLDVFAAVEHILANRAAAAVQARAEVVARVEALADDLARERDELREAFRRHNAGRDPSRPTKRPDLRTWSDAYEVAERKVRAALAGPDPRGGQDGGGE